MLKRLKNTRDIQPRNYRVYFHNNQLLNINSKFMTNDVSHKYYVSDFPDNTNEDNTVMLTLFKPRDYNGTDMINIFNPANIVFNSLNLKNIDSHGKLFIHVPTNIYNAVKDKNPAWLLDNSLNNDKIIIDARNFYGSFKLSYKLGLNDYHTTFYVLPYANILVQSPSYVKLNKTVKILLKNGYDFTDKFVYTSAPTEIYNYLKKITRGDVWTKPNDAALLKKCFIDKSNVKFASSEPLFIPFGEEAYLEFVYTGNMVTEFKFSVVTNIRTFTRNSAARTGTVYVGTNKPTHHDHSECSSSSASIECDKEYLKHLCKEEIETETLIVRKELLLGDLPMALYLEADHDVDLFDPQYSNISIVRIKNTKTCPCKGVKHLDMRDQINTNGIQIISKDMSNMQTSPCQIAICVSHELQTSPCICDISYNYLVELTQNEVCYYPDPGCELTFMKILANPPAWELISSVKVIDTDMKLSGDVEFNCGDVLFKKHVPNCKCKHCCNMDCASSDSCSDCPLPDCPRTAGPCEKSKGNLVGTGKLTVHGNLTVEGDIDYNGELIVEGSVLVYGSIKKIVGLTVSGNVVVDNDVTTYGSENINVTGNFIVGREWNMKGSSLLSPPVINGKIMVNYMTKVYESYLINGNLVLNDVKFKTHKLNFVGNPEHSLTIYGGCAKYDKLIGNGTLITPDCL